MVEYMWHKTSRMGNYLREKRNRKLHGRENKAEEFGKECMAKYSNVNAREEPITLNANFKKIDK